MGRADGRSPRVAKKSCTIASTANTDRRLAIASYIAGRHVARPGVALHR
jgi:hypothetical protein